MDTIVLTGVAFLFFALCVSYSFMLVRTGERKSDHILMPVQEEQARIPKRKEEPVLIAETVKRRLDLSLEEWVSQKRYCEYGRSREEIALDLDVTREDLNAYFAAVVGMDFNTWRSGLRINEARRLLLEDRMLPVNLVAELSGFSDRSNFHRQFVRHTGCSPKHWRESGGNPHSR